MGSRRGAIPIFTHTVEFPRDARERVPDVPIVIRVLHPRGKTFDEPVRTTTTADRPCQGRIYREQFSTLARSLALRSCLHARMYTQTRESPVAYGCVRAAWVISHAYTRRTAPLEYLSVCSRRVAPTTVMTIERIAAWKKSATCLENWSRSSPRFDKPFRCD